MGAALDVPLIQNGGLKVGRTALHPSLGIAEGITDNLFRTTQPFGARERDAVTVYAPGLQAQLPFSQHLLVLNYLANIERYSRFHRENVEDQDRTVALLLKLPGDLKARGLAQWKDGHDLRGSAVSTAGIATGPNKWFASTYGGEVLRENLLFARFRLKSTRWEYIGPNAGPRDGVSPGDINTRNRLEHYIALALGVGVAAKSYLFVEGSVGHALYEINRTLDSSTYTASIGMRVQETEKLAGELKLGWQRKALDRVPVSGASEFSGVSVDGNLYWRPRERTSIHVLVFRHTNETVLADTTFFVSTGGSVSASQTLTYKWRVIGLVAYNQDRYSNPTFFDNKFETRQDHYLTAGLGIVYQLRSWLGIRTTYTYLERLSNSDSSQYNANVAMVSIQAQF